MLCCLTSKYPGCATPLFGIGSFSLFQSCYLMSKGSAHNCRWFPWFLVGILAVLNLALQTDFFLLFLHGEYPAVPIDKERECNASSVNLNVSEDNIHGNTEAKAEVKEQLMPLPCVEEVRERTLNDQGLTEMSKTLLLSSLDKLTYERRDKWLSTLNPSIVTKSQLSKIRNVCPAESIALVLLTNGISNNVQEWLVYHLLMGVKKIIIFDDSVPASIEQMAFHKAIEPFIDQGYVVRHDVPEFPDRDFMGKEEGVDNLALQKYGSEYDWIGFIGSDEFIVLHQEKCLASFLGNYTEFGGVVLQWRWFSPVGVPYHDMEKTYFEQYQYTVEDGARHVKAIVQPKYVNHTGAHNAIYVDNWAVNFRKDPIDGPFNVYIDPSQEFSVVELRHFYMEDMQFALFEKVCGLNDQRIEFRGIRISMLHQIFHDGSLHQEISLPLIYNDLVEFMFNSSG